jgi:hypothetical protein
MTFVRDQNIVREIGCFKENRTGNGHINLGNPNKRVLTVGVVLLTCLPEQEEMLARELFDQHPDLDRQPV